MSDNIIDGLEKTEDKRGWLLSLLSLTKDILFRSKKIDDPTTDDLKHLSKEDLDNLSEKELEYFNNKYNELKEGKC